MLRMFAGSLGLIQETDCVGYFVSDENRSRDLAKNEQKQPVNSSGSNDRMTRWARVQYRSSGYDNVSTVLNA